MPDAVLHGRLWAEEGPIFYQRAATMPAWDALFAPYAGYLNLLANAAPIVARALLPLEAAPWVTTGIGLLFQCLPAVLLLRSRDGWLREPLVRVACLLLLATPPVTEEVWLQTLHAQFHLALCCALILAFDVPQGTRRWFSFALLAAGPLCGPAAACLSPLFLLRAAIDRSRPRLAQGLVLGAASAVQFLFFYSHQNGRSHAIPLTIAACVFAIKQVIVPFLGRSKAQTLAAGLQGRIEAGLFPLWAVIVAGAILAGLIAVVARRQLAAPAWMLASATLLFGVALYGSLSTGMGLLTVGEGGRYTFVPQVLIGLALVAVATGSRREAWVARAAVAWLIAVGVRDLPRSSPYIATGPDWRAEVAEWREDHSHPIAIWPQGWSMRLEHE